MIDNTAFKKELEERVKEINAGIAGYLPEEKGCQKTIFEAMNYSMNAGGKRLRPLLMQEVCRLFTGEVSEIVKPFMAAIEMIHTSSLVHDDLPCMDDDMIRRGKASTWAEYGEDIGVLAGDALMMYAFETASKAFDAAEDADALLRAGKAMGILAAKTGVYGMIGGQTVDVELAGGPVPKDKLDFIYRLKTGALLEASMVIGAVMAGASEAECGTVERMAAAIGLAFQIQDDILDVTSTEEELGKPIHSDEKNHKTTYVTLMGIEKASQQVKKLSDEAVTLFEGLNKKNEFLFTLVNELVGRRK